MKTMGENTVNDGKLELLKPPIPDVDRVEDEVEGEYARDNTHNDTSKPNTCSRNADIVTSSEGACTDHAEATENTEVAAKFERSKSSPSFHNQTINDEQDDVSIDDATSTDSHGAKDEIENSPNKLSSEPNDEQAESGAEAISAIEGPHIGEEEDDDDSSHQIAESESMVDRIEGRSGGEDRKDREDSEDLEIHTSNVQIDDEHQHLPVMEKSYLVLDSDEESIGPAEGRNDGDRRGNSRAELIGPDAELTRDAARLPQESLSVVPSLPNQTSAPAKSAAVSSAARAAIEAARVEAERMIAQTQSNDIRKEKREKKSKKDKDGGEKKKKKKKEKRQNDA